MYILLYDVVIDDKLLGIGWWSFGGDGNNMNNIDDYIVNNVLIIIIIKNVKFVVCIIGLFLCIIIDINKVNNNNDIIMYSININGNKKEGYVKYFMGMG